MLSSPWQGCPDGDRLSAPHKCVPLNDHEVEILVGGAAAQRRAVPRSPTMSFWRLMSVGAMVDFPARPEGVCVLGPDAARCACRCPRGRYGSAGHAAPPGSQRLRCANRGPDLPPGGAAAANVGGILNEIKLSKGSRGNSVFPGLPKRRRAGMPVYTARGMGMGRAIWA
jgi:hypothetical protein